MSARTHTVKEIGSAKKRTRKLVMVGIAMACTKSGRPFRNPGLPESAFGDFFIPSAGPQPPALTPYVAP